MIENPFGRIPLKRHGHDLGLVAGANQRVTQLFRVQFRATVHKWNVHGGDQDSHTQGTSNAARAAISQGPQRSLKYRKLEPFQRNRQDRSRRNLPDHRIPGRDRGGESPRRRDGRLPTNTEGYRRVPERPRAGSVPESFASPRWLPFGLEPNPP